ncbi:hypothetical protein Egran_06477 [Elaphomyces granulatus]|uniref:Cytochrome P450 n=1 Tax=Elaphomyces granulatus TaxID=519963 RepID=A0A232LNN1_9EURO|nr:hypothetical protein Egran_06477 [Elaphomyces granulatus]
MSILAIRNLQLRGVFFIELSLIGSAIFIVWLGVKFVIRYRKFSRFPLINGKRPFEFTWAQAKKRCYENAKELIQYGFTKARSLKVFLKKQAMVSVIYLQIIEVTVSMRRKALDGIRFHDGLEIPKGAFIGVSTHQMWDPTIYPEPEKFDGYRFLKRSQIQGHEKDSQFSAPSVDHMGWGYGKLACPGRFFAVDVIKVLLCHMLLKYDWKLPEGYRPVVRKVGLRLQADPAAKLLVRRRQEENCIQR